MTEWQQRRHGANNRQINEITLKHPILWSKYKWLTCSLFSYNWLSKLLNWIRDFRKSQSQSQSPNNVCKEARPQRSMEQKLRERWRGGGTKPQRDTEIGLSHPNSSRRWSSCHTCPAATVTPVQLSSLLLWIQTWPKRFSPAPLLPNYARGYSSILQRNVRSQRYCIDI